MLRYNLHRLLRKANVNIFNPIPYQKHISARKFIIISGEEIMKTYFSFSFVRNPWDWQVSLYNYMLTHPEHYQHKKIKALGSFDAYIRWRAEYGITPQKYFISSEQGELLVDVVGKFENLHEDFIKICNHLGISATLPHLNYIEKKHYSEYYTPETRDLVAKACLEDIQSFGYTFL